MLITTHMTTWKQSRIPQSKCRTDGTINQHYFNCKGPSGNWKRLRRWPGDNDPSLFIALPSHCECSQFTDWATNQTPPVKVRTPLQQNITLPFRTQPRSKQTRSIHGLQLQVCLSGASFRSRQVNEILYLIHAHTIWRIGKEAAWQVTRSSTCDKWGKPMYTSVKLGNYLAALQRCINWSDYVVLFEIS